MKYKLVMVQKLGPTEEELNALSKKGYRLVSGPVIVKGGKSYLVMEKPKSKPKSTKKDPPSSTVALPMGEGSKQFPIEKISEDSVEVK